MYSYFAGREDKDNEDKEKGIAMSRLIICFVIFSSSEPGYEV